MRSDRGVTLVELMVVVIIVALLAAVATVGYASYLRRAKATEARANLAMIATRQEAYKAEFGVYKNVDCVFPTAIDCGRTKYWEASAGTADCWQKWRDLGWRPDNPNVAFRYRADGGDATVGAVPAWATALIDATVRTYGWYALEAVGNLRCAGAAETTYQMTSTNTTVINRNEFE